MNRARVHQIVGLVVWAGLGGNSGCFAQDAPVTPVADAPAAKGWRAETVIEGLDHPWAIAWLPDGATLITERPGRMRVFNADGTVRVDAVGGVPTVAAVGQGGLMDVALHPKFADNHLVYFTYSEGSSRANRTVLARGVFDGTALTGVETIFAPTQYKPGGQHFGSRLLWLPDGTLLMSLGDGGNPPVEVDGELTRYNAQKLTSDLGKTVRLNEDGTAAAGNPLAAKEGARPELWTMGHRNIQGLALDPESGRVWATEHGARGGDELNLLVGGENYGWHLVTFSKEYSGPAISDKTSAPGFIDPKAVWTPCIAPSGLAFYTGDKMPAWQGNLFAGGLVLQQVRRLILDGDKVVGQETLQFEDRIRDVRQGPDGYLYVLTDETDGKLVRIVGE